MTGFVVEKFMKSRWVYKGKYESIESAIKRTQSLADSPDPHYGGLVRILTYGNGNVLLGSFGRM